MEQGGQYYFYHNDQLGTPQQMTSVSGAVVWAAQYGAFGQAQVDAGSSVVNNLRFPGQYYDEETGLHYNWHRYYDSGSGRYITADPIGLDGGINLFEYSRSNPNKYFDSTGKSINFWSIRYGNYCGPGTDLSTMQAPIDVVDEACQEHDLCYQKYNIKWYIPRSIQCNKRECDRNLASKLDSIIVGDLENLSPEALWYAKKAYFEFKSSFEEPSWYELNYCCP